MDRHTRLAALVAVAALLGCAPSVPQPVNAGSSQQEAGREASSAALVDALRPEGSRLVSFTSPAELMERSKVVARGVIVDVSAGRQILYSPVDFPEEVDPHVTVDVELTDVVQGEGRLGAGQHVFVELPVRRGVERDLDVEALEAMVGVDVVLALTDAHWPQGGVEVRDAFAGRPQDAPLYAPWAGGFVFETDGVTEDLFLGSLPIELSEAWSHISDLEELMRAYQVAG